MCAVYDALRTLMGPSDGLFDCTIYFLANNVDGRHVCISLGNKLLCRVRCRDCRSFPLLEAFVRLCGLTLVGGGVLPRVRFSTL